MLGLMQILHFVLDARTLPLAREIFALSQHETQARPSLLRARSPQRRRPIESLGAREAQKPAPRSKGSMIFALSSWGGEEGAPQRAEEPNRGVEPSSSSWI